MENGTVSGFLFFSADTDTSPEKIRSKHLFTTALLGGFLPQRGIRLSSLPVFQQLFSLSQAWGHGCFPNMIISLGPNLLVNLCGGTHVSCPCGRSRGGPRRPGGIAMPIGDTELLASAFNFSPALTQPCPCRSFGGDYRVIISSKCFCRGFSGSDTFLYILP